jgi:hypothetical protein
MVILKVVLIKWLLIVSAGVYFLFSSELLFGQCIGLTRGAVAVDVRECRVFRFPQDVIPTLNMSFYHGMVASDKAAFAAQYEGALILRGVVATSKAVRSGLSTDQGALKGDRVVLFQRPGGLPCSELVNKRVAGVLNEVCCNGQADAPCASESTYIFSNGTPIGAAGSAAGDEQRKRSRGSKNYQEGMAFIEKRDFERAVKALEEAKKNKELDFAGRFHLAFAYREIDNCRKARRILRELVKQKDRNQVWGDQFHLADEAVFLLARCEARLDNAGRAVMILSDYLINIGRHEKRVRESLRHPDFGRIYSTKEWKRYSEEAHKKLFGRR